jgi:hypothetical protein
MTEIQNDIQKRLRWFKHVVWMREECNTKIERK